MMLGGTGNVRETLASVVVDVGDDDGAASCRGVARIRCAWPVAFIPLEVRVDGRRMGRFNEEIRIARR